MGAGHDELVCWVDGNGQWRDQIKGVVVMVGNIQVWYIIGWDRGMGEGWDLGVVLLFRDVACCDVQKSPFDRVVMRAMDVFRVCKG